MNPKIIITDIEKYKSSPWDFGNEVLYDLCKNNFYHQDPSKILAKVWLIGRAYSAAIERRKNKETINDNFYIEKVAPTFKNSELDSHLSFLLQHDKLTIDNIPNVLETHYYLTKLTASITGLEKRSLSSKYLHFHLPHLFFIYDSRVVSALRQYVDRIPKSMNYLIENKLVDKEYGKFVCKCFILKQKIENANNIVLTTRQLDNILIDTTNKKLGLKDK